MQGGMKHARKSEAYKEEWKKGKEKGRGKWEQDYTAPTWYFFYHTLPCTKGTNNAYLPRR
jgi:hypothetical protein